MINILPQTEVRLLKTPLEKEGNHTMTFSNINSQTAYFLSKTIKTYTDFTYQRETASLVVGDPFDTINTCNYLMYRNNGFSNKYFYAYITKMEYISENSTRIYFEIDSLQTWYFNINYKECFVEREHVNDDTIGLHTVPEGLETGEYIEQPTNLDEAFSGWNYFDGNYEVTIVCAISEMGLDITVPSGSKQYNGIFSGLWYIAFRTGTDCTKFIEEIQRAGKADSIYNVFLVPSKVLGSVNYFTPSAYDFSMGWVPFSNSENFIESPFVIDTRTIDSNYVPNNNKLLCFPYRYFIVSNNAGIAKDYRYELFNQTQDNECEFNISGALSTGCSIKAFPVNYNLSSSYGRTNLNFLESIDACKLPTCSWITDPYTNWLTQNAVNMGISSVANVGSIVAGIGLIASGAGAPAGAGMIATGVSGVANQLAQVYEHSLIPDTAHGGTNQGDLNFATKTGFTVSKKTIRTEYARIIDDYFSMYGYKINSIKVPNITGRANWNYVKTIDCNFTGDIPQEDIEKIRDLFNNGITFWHNEENFLNYSASNGII